MRWPDGVRCPRCKSEERIYALKARPFHWACCNNGCGGRRGYRFSVITQTIFENTKIPLKIWFKVAYLILTAKKGISALQVHRVIFGEESTHAYHTSWYICMRWRAAMKGDVMPLDGVVEVDETFVGGKAHNMHASKRKALGPDRNEKQSRRHRRDRSQGHGRRESDREYRYRDTGSASFARPFQKT